MVVVQLIEVLWTKSSRGAPNAAIRNSLPRFAIVTAHAAMAYYFQRFSMDEARNFELRLVEERTSATIPQNEFELLIAAGDPLIIGMQPDLHTGQPPRDRAPRAISIPRGGWGRLILNGLHTSYRGQHYRQATYNVGFVDAPSAAMFSGEPEYRVSFEADLF